MYNYDIITDSTSDLTKELREKYNISYAHMNVIINNVEHIADLDWNEFSAKEFYDYMRDGTKITTTLVPSHEYERCFKESLDAGKDVLYLGCSSKLSGSVNVAKFVAEELRKAYEEAKRINEENERLAQLFGGSYAFVKTLSDAVLETNLNRSDIEALLSIVYENIKDTVYDDVLIMQGKKGFVDSTKALVTKIIIKNGLYKIVKSYYDDILEMLYVNLLNYKETI
jgi:hypothetical protein